VKKVPPWEEALAAFLGGYSLGFAFWISPRIGAGFVLVLSGAMLVRRFWREEAERSGESSRE
jgi:hypothetical protein